MATIRWREGFIRLSSAQRHQRRLKPKHPVTGRWIRATPAGLGRGPKPTRVKPAAPLAESKPTRSAPSPLLARLGGPCPTARSQAEGRSSSRAAPLDREHRGPSLPGTGFQGPGLQGLRHTGWWSAPLIRKKLRLALRGPWHARNNRCLATRSATRPAPEHGHDRPARRGLWRDASKSGPAAPCPPQAATAHRCPPQKIRAAAHEINPPKAS